MIFYARLEIFMLNVTRFVYQAFRFILSLPDDWQIPADKQPENRKRMVNNYTSNDTGIIK